MITIELLPETAVRKELNGLIEFQKTSAFNQMMTFLNHTRQKIQTNFFASALGTNWMLATYYTYDGDFFITASQVEVVSFSPLSTVACAQGSGIMIATLKPLSNDSIVFSSRQQMILSRDLTMVNGFFVGCTPLEALLESTLDCLYQVECLEVLFDNFPSLDQVRIYL